MGKDRGFEWTTENSEAALQPLLEKETETLVERTAKQLGLSREKVLNQLESMHGDSDGFQAFLKRITRYSETKNALDNTLGEEGVVVGYEESFGDQRNPVNGEGVMAIFEGIRNRLEIDEAEDELPNIALGKGEKFRSLGIDPESGLRIFELEFRDSLGYPNTYVAGAVEGLDVRDIAEKALRQISEL